MSQRKSSESSKRRVFSEEFKQDAVRLVAREGYSLAASALTVGVDESSLRQGDARLAVGMHFLSAK